MRRGVEVAHAGLPGRRQRSAPLVLADLAAEVADRRRPEGQRTDGQAAATQRPCHGSSVHADPPGNRCASSASGVISAEKPGAVGVQ